MEKEELDFNGKQTENEKTMTYSNRIEGVGTIEVYGSVNMEKLIKKINTSRSEG